MKAVFDLNLISSIGLVMDILGAIFIFKYGLPSKVSDGGGMLLEEPIEVEQERSERNRAVYKKATWGLILLITGFVLQLFGTNLRFS